MHLGDQSCLGDQACLGDQVKKMSDSFRFERLPVMSSAENHPNGPGAFEQPRFNL